jgi:hypothetical protein
MATVSVVLVAVSLYSCLLTATTAVSHTERTRWGDVRPARVLDINDTINVHVVPHTHDDVGWLKTVDEYYYGGIERKLVALIVCLCVCFLVVPLNLKFYHFNRVKR